MRFAILLVLAAVALGQGTDPKPKAEDYDVHADTPKGALGAEYMVHSFSGQGVTYIAKDYLVVEVALYPPKGETIQVHAANFSLRINGRNTPLAPVAASVVAAALQHPDWQQQGPHVEAGGGVGNTSVILGRPTPSRLPGEQPPQRLPHPTGPGNHDGIDRQSPVKAEELVVQAALPEDPYRGSISGYIYFPYKGKPSAIKSLDLLFEGVSIKLR
jgi:hypothetical protein